MSPELRKLAQRHKGLLSDAQAILTTAQDDGDRDLTDDELAAHAQLVAKAKGLKTLIDAQLEIEGSGIAIPNEPAPAAGTLTGGAPVVEQDPKCGFSSFGDFSIAVKQASLGQSQDDRLSIMAATPSTYGNEAVGADGGYLVPADFRSEIMSVVVAQDSLFSRTDQIPVGGNMLQMPTDETTDWQTSGGITTGWEDEVSAMTGSKPAIDMAEWHARKITSLVNVSDDLLEDAIAMDGYLRSRVPRKIRFAIDLSLVQGNGVKRPLGFLNSPAAITVAKESGQTADTIVTANINKMYQRFPQDNIGNSFWLANQDIMQQLENLEFVGTNASLALFVPAGGMADAPFARLKGRPIIYHQAASTLGDKGDLSLVDMSQYATVVKSGGIKVDVSMHLYFDSNATAYRFVMRVGGHPWMKAPIQPRTGSNTLSPFVTLAERA